MTDHAAEFLARLDAVAGRLADQAAASPPPEGLTDADPKTGEQWEAGQAWAHLAEFCPYWIAEVHKVVDGWDGSTPVPFGRIKTNPDRVAAIERDRHEQVSDLFARTSDGIAAVRDLLRSLPADAWSAVGVHQTLGEMPLPKIVDEFLVGHLEEHATQLESLRG